MDETNPIKRLFKAIAEVIDEYTGKERAVNLSQIWQSVQKKLDEGGADGMPAGYVLDIYAENNGVSGMVTKGDGKLYKIPVAVGEDSAITVGEMVEVVTNFAPVARGLTVRRGKSGALRWFALPACTAVLNRSGEIDSRALFDSFVEHIERTDNYPELDFFHFGERLVFGKADWVGRDGVAYCASGTFYDTDIARAAAKSIEENGGYWGLSIAYVPTKEADVIRSADGLEIPVYNAGINRFISLLPEDTAASILTTISTQKENEVNRMEKRIEDALKKLTGSDEALFNELATKLDGVNRSADGMISREETPAETPAQEPPVARAFTDDEINLIVASDAFKNAVAEIVAAKLADGTMEESKEDAKEEAAPVVETSTERAVDPTAELKETIATLQAAVAELTKERKAEKEIEKDLPAKFRNDKSNIIRPRAAILPDTVNKRGANYAELANRTLQKMGAESA